MMLSPEAYAEAYGVKAVTVRQWIRRGKLRAAKKVGNSWKISELCSKPSRGYTSAEYNWKEELENLPVDFEYFNNYNVAQFFAKTSEPGKYEVVFVNSEDSNLPLKLTLSLQEREWLELFMISHPQIECEETYIHEFL